MKIIVVAALVLCVAVQVLAVSEENERIAARKKCQADSGVDPQVVEDVLHGKTTEDPKYKIHITCFYTELDILNGNQINKDKFKEYLEVAFSEGVEEIAQKCAQEKDNPQETAFEMSKCVINQRKIYKTRD